MDANILTEKLLSYAAEKLCLEVSDVDFKRAVLNKLFGAEPSTAVKECPVPDFKELYAELKSFLFEKGVDDVDSYARFVIGLLQPLPSAVDKTFKLTKERVSSKKAQEYLVSLVKAGGYLGNVTFKPISQQNKTVCVYLIDEVLPETGVSDCDSFNNRSVTFGIDGEYLYYLDCRGDYNEQGGLYNFDKTPFVLNERSLDAMFGFVDNLTDSFITASFSDGDSDRAADKFVVGRETLPLFNAEAVSVLRSEVCPDVEVNVTSHALSSVRFSSYNKITMIRLMDEVLSKWLSLGSDDSLAEPKKRYAPFALRLLPDGRYSADVVFCYGENSFTLNDSPVAKLFVNLSEYSRCFGKFIINPETAALIKKATKFITGKVQFNYGAVKSSDEFYELADVIAVAAKTSGVIKDEQRAEAAVYEALRSSVVTELKISDGFNEDGAGLLRLKTFLSSCGIKQI